MFLQKKRREAEEESQWRRRRAVGGGGGGAVKRHRQSVRERGKVHPVDGGPAPLMFFCEGGDAA